MQLRDKKLEKFEAGLKAEGKAGGAKPKIPAGWPARGTPACRTKP